MAAIKFVILNAVKDLGARREVGAGTGKRAKRFPYFPTHTRLTLLERLTRRAMRDSIMG